MEQQLNTTRDLLRLHDGHIEGYRCAGGSLFVQVRKWNSELVELLFRDVRMMRDVASSEQDLQSLVQRSDETDLNLLKVALIARDCAADDLASFSTFAFISLDGDDLMTIIARDVQLPANSV